MSFLQKIFGGTFESNREEGEQLFISGNFGEAKLCFDRALQKGKKASSTDVAAVRERIVKCKLELARKQIQRADDEAASGLLEEAVAHLREAREVCSEPEIVENIQERLRSYEKEDARRLTEEAEEIADDELLSIIAGTWSPEQAQEYATLPDDFKEALLLGHDKDHAAAARILGEIVEREDLYQEPCYVWLELGRAYLLSGQSEKAIEALDSFLSALDRLDEDEDAGEDALDVQVMAHELKAAAFLSQKETDKAREELVLTTRLQPENHVVFLKLGVFLRSQKEYEAALRVLEKARELMGQMHPDFQVIRELGLTYLDMEDKKEAAACLGAVIEHLASRGEHDQFDPIAAVALAKIHEENGDFNQASDLYRHLAVGYDTQNHFVYNVEAARLLRAAGADEQLIDRYLTRARELAKEPEQEALLDKVDSHAEN